MVHGPLVATLFLALLRRELPKARVSEFSFRAMHLLVDTSDFAVCGSQQEGCTVRLWAQDAEGWLATSASARLA